MAFRRVGRMCPLEKCLLFSRSFQRGPQTALMFPQNVNQVDQLADSDMCIDMSELKPIRTQQKPKHFNQQRLEKKVGHVNIS